MADAQASTRTQLQWLKTLTHRTGAIHEAQSLQLKLYPMMLPNAKTAEARVDIEKKAVKYIVTCKPLKKGALFDKVCTEMAGWTRWLLWDDTKVTIEVNGKVMYVSGK